MLSLAIDHHGLPAGRACAQAVVAVLGIGDVVGMQRPDRIDDGALDVDGGEHHAFDQMVADRYVGESTWSKRIVRERYDQPVPKTDRGLTSIEGADGSTNGRAAARAKAAVAR